MRKHRNIKIGTTTIGKGLNTLGLEIVSNEIKKAGYDVRVVDQKTAKDVDVLLISLYWVEQVLLYPRWLVDAKINPSDKRPIIVLGGMVMFNPHPLKGMFDYAVIGDGEGVAVKLVDAISKNEIPDYIPGVLNNEKITECVVGNVAKELPMDHYIELRNNKITRIELARGCKQKCKFCQLSHTKPYREIPPSVLKGLICTAPTKSVALFAPDRGSYSGYEKIEKWMAYYNKANQGSDIRLTTLRKTAVATKVRFGIEGFSEGERKLVGKPYPDEKLVDDFMHVIKDIKTPKGKHITALTWYMILGLPGQNESCYREFAELLREIDGRCNNLGRKITVFLSCSDFMPTPHTPMQDYSKDIWTDHYTLWNKEKPFLKNITIAARGGTRGVSTRLAQLLVFRGGESSNKALFNLSTNRACKKLLKERSKTAGIQTKTLFQRCGVDVDGLINGYDSSERPWGNIKPFDPNWRDNEN